MTLTFQEAQAADSFSPRRSSIQMTWICLPLVLVLSFLSRSAWADQDEDKYLHIVEVVQQADALSAKGQTNAALARYQEAQIALRSFRLAYPDWNPRAVVYRQKYVAQKIQAFLEQAPPSTESPGVAAQATPTAGAVRLIDAGSEPRKALRLHPNAGDQQSLTLEIQTATETKVGEMETPAVKLPPMNLALDVAVKEVSSQGDITYSVTIADATVGEETGGNPQVAAAIKPMLEGLKGLVTAGTMTSRGSNKDLRVKSSAGSNPQAQQATDLMNQSFAALAIPLPEEPVGVGARWEQKAPVKAQGITYDQTTTYELTSLEGELLALKAVVSQSAANQKIQSPAMPGLKLDLTRMTGKGTGEITSSLTQLLPQKAAMDSHSELSMGMNAGGQKQTLFMKVDVTMRLQQK